MDISVSTQVLGLIFLIALVLGAVVNKTNFCTMGAVSDWINMGDTGRLRAWFLAIAVAIAGVSLFEALQIFDTGDSRVPYRGAIFFWPRYLLGGLMFGVGMTIASGCGNKTLVRIGGGNLKSLVVAVVIGIMAYLMTRTDFYGIVFHSWMLPLSPDLSLRDIPDQSLGTLLGSLLGAESPSSLNLWMGIALVLLLLFVVFRSPDFRKDTDLLVGGVIVGLAVVAAWYVTGGPLGAEWVEATEFMDEPPMGVGMQSFTFVNPTGETLSYLSDPANLTFLTVGVASVFGVIVGSFIYALFSGGFRIEWFVDFRDFLNHLYGGTLMGIGGVLAMGCTIGQGVTGVSTLALGSFLALASIIIGSALTMKVQYYKMVYEEEASFSKALLSGMADLHLLPQKMRRLDAV